MANSDTRELILSEAKIHISRCGKGDALLLLHGAGGSANMIDMWEKLATNYDVILPDHPGFGRSEQSNMLNSVADLAFHYLDLIEELDLNDIHLVGHSMGGWIAAEIAIRSTTKAKSLTLISSAGIHVKGVPKGDLFLWSPEELIQNLYVNKKIVNEMLSYEPTGDELEIMVKNRVAAARYAWQPRLYNPDLSKWLHRIDVPTLILWGDQDKIFPADYATEFKAMIPQAQLEIINQCGHVPHMDRPDTFYPRLRKFLAEASL